MSVRRGVGGLAVAAGLLCAGAAALTTAARYLPPTSAPTAPDTWGVVTAFTDYGLAGYAAALVLLGLGLVLRRSRTGLGLTVLALVLSVLHASWVGPAFVPGPRPAGSGPTIRVLAANLYFGRADPAAVAAAARAADVLVLTEVTAPARQRLRDLGVEQDLPYAGGGELPTRGAAGTLVLSRFPVRATEPLPSEVEHQNWLVTLDVAGFGPVQVAAVHPSPPRQGRTVWAADHRLLRAALARGSGPTIVAGDFNAVPSHWPMRRLRADGFRTSVDLAGAGWQPTWPADRSGLPPVVAIDHVLLSPEFTATAAGVQRIPGSDHLAVTATVVPVG
jgi:endonuclease/exonuclease/phosphatase (EEP) superfamily protein YafD